MSITNEEWAAAVGWDAYYAGVKAHADLWRHHFDTAAVDDLTARRLAALPGPRRVLILTEDWCGDAARTVPVIVKALSAAPGVEVRLLPIDDHPETILRYLTRGGKAIPVAIVLDEHGRELGWWGPRPAPLQALLRRQVLEQGSPKKEEMGKFYAPIMAWYRKDEGRTTLEEVTLLLERGGEPR